MRQVAMIAPNTGALQAWQFVPTTRVKRSTVSSLRIHARTRQDCGLNLIV